MPTLNALPGAFGAEILDADLNQVDDSLMRFLTDALYQRLLAAAERGAPRPAE